MIISEKRITKELIRLRGCAGWSAPVLFAKTGFSRRGPYDNATIFNLSERVLLRNRIFVITYADSRFTPAH